jgi:hypothetical protein
MWTADKSELESSYFRLTLEVFQQTDSNRNHFNRCGNLTGIATDQPTLTFESIGTDTFSYSPAGIEIHFKESKNEFTLR